MATIGTIAQMLMHEIRNRTISFGSFIRRITKELGPFEGKLLDSCNAAQNATNSLERLADTFSPLASRSFQRRKRKSHLSERLQECLKICEKDIQRTKTNVSISPSLNIEIAVDPGELDGILLNLITNALYWITETPEGKRRLIFRANRISNGKRIRVALDDTGPGIKYDPPDKVLLPGITGKPGGIGMGLTVTAELVAEYGGELSIQYPGQEDGATFIFDLPLK